MPALEPFIEEFGTSFEYLANEIASKENVINVEPKKILISDENGKVKSSNIDADSLETIPTALEGLSLGQMALIPGAITWDRDPSNKFLISSATGDGINYGLVKVGEVNFNKTDVEFFM
jgi:hypothetical protein